MLKQTGQYVEGIPFGTWTTYNEQEKIIEISVLDSGETLKLITSDNDGNIIEYYDISEE